MGGNESDVPDDREVVETRDVSDLDESEVNSEIDEMLAGDDQPASDQQQQSADDEDDGLAFADVDEVTDDQTASHEQPVSEETTASVNPDAGGGLEAADPANISVEELEAQDWTLGEEVEDKIIEFKGMKFMLSEPPEDEVLDIIGGTPGQQADPADNMRRLCQSTIKAPTLTDERWDGLNVSEKLGLLIRVSQFIGIDDFMDFQDVGPEAQPGT